MNDEQMAAGWYPAAGDPPGTQRWWDGQSWVGDAVAAPVAAPAAGHGALPPSHAYEEKSEAVVALILGILGFVVCQLTSPFAWQIGQRELDAIDAGRRDPKDRGLATAGKILGIVGTALLVLAILGLVLFLVLGVAAA